MTSSARVSPSQPIYMTFRSKDLLPLRKHKSLRGGIAYLMGARCDYLQGYVTDRLTHSLRLPSATMAGGKKAAVP